MLWVVSKVTIFLSLFSYNQYITIFKTYYFCFPFITYSCKGTYYGVLLWKEFKQ